MESYGNRGVFSALSNRLVRVGVRAFTAKWHRALVFTLIVDANKRTLAIPVVLPNVPARSAMYREYRSFVASHHSPSLPPHRRTDTSKARVACRNRRGHVSLIMTITGDQYVYGTQRLIHLVHETFLFFLAEGQYYEYRVEQLGDDPDWI
jgi:hypothetical protein